MQELVYPIIIGTCVAPTNRAVVDQEAKKEMLILRRGTDELEWFQKSTYEGKLEDVFPQLPL